MNFNKLSITIGGALLVSTLLSSTAFAEKQKTIDEYINAARPNLHHSCETAWESADEKADPYIAIVNSFVAISFINHDFDVKIIKSASEADQKKLQEVFYDEIGRRCKIRPQSLLAGVVEDSLIYALNKVRPAADKDLEAKD